MSYSFLTKPYDHQLEIFNKSKDLEYYGLFLEMGLGKTKIILDTLGYLFEENEIEGALILANKGSYRNWIKEIKLHLNIKSKPIVWGSMYQTSVKEFNIHFKNFDGLKIFLMNIEALSYPKGLKFAYEFLDQYVSMLIIDEATAIKNRTAKRSKASLSLGKSAKYRRILTGSPITKTPLDLWNLCEFLKTGSLGFRSFHGFKNTFANIESQYVFIRNKKQQIEKITGYRELDKLKEIWQKFAVRKTKKECLDLPPKIYETVLVDLTDEQVFYYKKLKKELLVEFENEIEERGTISATIALTQMIKLHQIVCGYLRDSETNMIKYIDSNRIESILKQVEEVEGKIVIWTSHIPIIPKINFELRKNYGENSVVEYHGKINDTARTENVRRFMEDSTTKFFIGNPSVGGYGIDLFSSSTVFYFANSWNYEHRIQSEDRVHRIGQTKSVTYIDFLTENTIDTVIYESLQRKEDLANHILGDPEKIRRILS